MAKDRHDTVDLLQQQNQLLQSLNQLLKQQNDLMRGSSEPVEEREEFVENLYRDEMRCGFLVTSHRKKLWNVQIGLINEFARICKKYNLRWFAYGGTLLGAVRHKGFIPWDDDVDVAMFRPDYEKFKKIAPTEIKPPYFFDNWCNYRMEGDENLKPEDLQLPLISPGQLKRGGFPLFPLIKIRDSRTTMIEFPDQKSSNQGIWIDVFPFDVLPPFKDEKQKITFETGRTLFIATSHPNLIRDAMKNNQQFRFSRDELENFLQLPYRERVAKLEDFLLKNFYKSQRVGQLMGSFYNLSVKVDYRTTDFDKIIYLPFEKIEIPAPSNYDSVLKTQYGDWHKFIVSYTHAVKDYSADIPYDEYFKTVSV